MCILIRQSCDQSFATLVIFGIQKSVHCKSYNWEIGLKIEMNPFIY